MTHLSTPSLFAKSKVEVFDPVHFVCIPGFEAAVRFYCTIVVPGSAQLPLG